MAKRGAASGVRTRSALLRGLNPASASALAVALVLLGGNAAQADCAPAAVNNVTATCSGTTTNQGVGAPGTSASTQGYGSGTQTNVTITIVGGATVTGSDNGIDVGNGTFTNNPGATITGVNEGITTRTGVANVTNAGTIRSTSGDGIFSQTDAIVTNNAGGVIQGGAFDGVHAETGNATVTNAAGATINGALSGVYGANGATVTNSGSITGMSASGIATSGAATVVNNAGATITGTEAIFATTGVNVTNSGTITGTDPTSAAILTPGPATVTNNSGATIIGALFGVYGANGATVTNSGSITGMSASGIATSGAATVVNNAGATITGTEAIFATTGVNVTNSGTITGTDPTSAAILTPGPATVTNNSGATIIGASGVFAVGPVTVTNSGTIRATSAVGIRSTGGSVTLINNAGGVVAGAAFGHAITANGSGSSIFNAGTITGGDLGAILFSGAGNVLTLAPSSVISGVVTGAGGDTLQLGGSGAASFDMSQVGPAAQYQGFTTFNKIDGSTWTLTGTPSQATSWTISGGVLSVNGAMPSSTIAVNNGGTLGGNGTVGNTTINAGGTLAPGNSIGLLTVQGSLVFTAASSYMVEVSPANADRTNVTGTATLGGATVNANFAPGTYVEKKYTILSAGSVNGTFGSFVNSNLPGGFKSSLSYDANNAYLDLALIFVPPQGTGLNINQQNVGNAIVNFFNTTGGIPLVFGGLAPAGLTQVSGETATGSQQTTFNAMNQFMGVMTDPFVAGRDDPISAGGNPNAFADDQTLAYAAKRKPNDALAAIYTKAPPVAPAFEQRWSVWAAGFGGSQTTSGDPTVLGSNNTRSSLAAGAVGADYRISPNTLAGFALAGGGTSFSVNGFGSGRSDLFQAGAFIRHNVGPAYITGALAYGWQDVTTDRTVIVAGIDRLRAQFNANAWSGRVEGGYRFVSKGFGWTPYAAGQFTTFELPAYAEQAIVGSNIFALGYAAKSVTATRSELGLRTDKSFAVENGIFTLRGRAAWAHDFNPDRAIGATFQTLPGASFVVNGARQASDAALVTGSAEMKWLNGWSIAGTFEGEFSNVTRSYAGKGVVRYAW